MESSQKQHSLEEMMIVVIIIGILLGVILPKMNKITNDVNANKRNKTRIIALDQIKSRIETSLKKDPSLISKLNGNKIYCLNEKLNDIFTKKVYLKDPLLNHINYGTKIGGCKGQYGFIYNSEKNEIGLIATFEKTKRKSVNINYIIDLNYYKNNKDNKKFINVFDKNNWKYKNFISNKSGNSYIEIINLNDLLKN